MVQDPERTLHRPDHDVGGDADDEADAGNDEADDDLDDGDVEGLTARVAGLAKLLEIGEEAVAIPVERDADDVVGA